MHPYISKFPNTTFYDGRIIDATKNTAAKIFVGNIFGNYSFINIEDGIEEQICQSAQNMVEAAVATTIVSKLSKGIVRKFWSFTNPIFLAIIHSLKFGLQLQHAATRIRKPALVLYLFMQPK